MTVLIGRLVGFMGVIIFYSNRAPSRSRTRCNRREADGDRLTISILM